MSEANNNNFKGDDLERVQETLQLVKGTTFNKDQVESDYIRIEHKLMKSITLAHKLLKILTEKTVKRFLEEHSDYQMDKLKHSNFVIKSTNPFKQIFNFIVNLTIVYSVLYGLYYLTFGMDEENFSYTEIVAWVFFLIDFCLNFCTEYIDEKNYPVRNLSLITLRYCRTWMVFDLLALLPLKMFGHREIEYFFRLSRVVKTNRIFYTFSTKNLTNYLRGSISALNANTQKLFLVLETITDFCFEICKFMFFCYFFACFWYYVARKVEDRYEDDKSFLIYFGIHEKPQKEQVVIIYYFMFTTLTTVGYGDYFAKNSVEMGFCILMMLIGSTWLALTMNKVISFVKEFEEIGKPKDNLSELTVFMHNLEHIHGPMPPALKLKLFKHFQYFWKNDRLGSLMNPDWTVKGDQILFIHDHTLRKLPEYIQTNIINYLFQDYFSYFPKFFRYAGRFRFDIALHFQPRFYDQEFILLKDERARELLFTKTGNVQVGFLKADESFTPCFNLPSGVIIGESSIFLDEVSFADFKAIKVEGMSLAENAILEILLLKYPKKLKQYTCLVKKRLTLLKRRLRQSQHSEEMSEINQSSEILSTVCDETLEKPKILDLYNNMKNLKTMRKRLRKEIDLININYFK